MCIDKQEKINIIFDDIIKQFYQNIICEIIFFHKTTISQKTGGLNTKHFCFWTFKTLDVCYWFDLNNNLVKYGEKVQND